MNLVRRLFLLLALLFAAQADAASRFGVCVTACTWDASDTTMWSATSGGTTGASVPGSGDTVTFDAATCVGGVTCTITVNATINVTSITAGACTASTTGCILDFSVNNNNVTASTVSFSGSGTRNIKGGTGTWTITSGAAANVYDNTTVTNETLAFTTTTLTFSANTTSQRAFNGGGKSYGTVNIASNSNHASFRITGGNNTFGTLTVAAGTAILFGANTTQTITNAFALAGTSSLPILIAPDSMSTGGITISTPSGTATLDWGGAVRATFSGGATFNATNSLDFGGNSGITITPPSTGGGGGRIIGG